MKDQVDKEFHEVPSKKHKEAVFKAVQSELIKNKKASEPALPWLSWQSAGLAAFASLFLYFQFINPIYKPNEFALDSNLVTELASLSPQEREVVEELDFIEALDQLSEEDLKEITL
jgi:hypothetical protein